MINRQTLATAYLQISLTKLMSRQEHILNEIKCIKEKYKRFKEC